MGNIEFRELKSGDTDSLRELVVRNNVPFDYEIPLRVLDSSVPPKSRIIGCFDKNELVGMYMAYAFKLLFCGIEKDAAVATFSVVDKTQRKKGLGIKMGHEMAAIMKDSGFDFVTSSINASLVGKWSHAINSCWESFGYEVKELWMVSPCFRRPGAKLPETSLRELPNFKVERLAENDMNRVSDHAEKFLTRYYIAQMPDENAAGQLAKFPGKYSWYSVSCGGRQAGFVSCYVYCERKKDQSVQNKLIFDNMMVDDVYLPGAVNAIVCDLENSGAKYDLYVVNNTSVTNKPFLHRSAFTPGFTRFQPFLRCCSQDESIKDVFRKIDSKIPFSLPIM